MGRTTVDDLPKGWANTTLEEVSALITDGTHQTPSYTQEGVPFVSTANLRPFSVGFDFSDYKRFISAQEHLVLTKRCHADRGDILISKCGTIGRVKEVDVDFPFSIFVGVALLKPRRGIFQPKFAEFWLNSAEVKKQFDELSPGSTRRTLTLKGIKGVTIPLPPFDEQRRIATRLEQLLTKVDACQKRLEKIPVILKRFHQSVLAAACSGRLTADWREDNLPPPAIESVEINEHCFPEAWSRTKMEPLFSPERKGMKTGPFGSALKKHEHQSSGIPVLGIENIGYMQFREGSKIHITPEKAKQLLEYQALPGDVLISRSGTVGEVCVVPPGLGEARISTNIMRVVISENKILPIFFCYLFNGSPFVLSQVEELCKGSTRDFLNQTILKAIVFPLPPLPEQHEIVRRVQALFGLANQIETRYQKAKAHVDKLTQSILAKAFRGELVPQDPNDEPASVLLKRIQEGRAKQALKLKQGGDKPKVRRRASR
jgi:type I restriction enzyme S subunit